MLKPAVSLAALALLTQAASAETCKPGEHWSYNDAHGTGPACWAVVNPTNRACLAGKRQSPIDLDEASMSAQSDKIVEAPGYTPAPLTLTHNGHTILVEIPDGQTYSVRQYVWIEGGLDIHLAPVVSNFKLAHIHFHTPSEHRIGGEQYPLEAHMVHLGPGDQRLVRAVIFREGATPHPFLSQLLAVKLPENEDQAVAAEDKMIDPNALYGAAGKHIEYLGSFTTPDCQEGVTWRISAQVAIATKEQIDAIRSAIGMDNARPVQPINDREVYFWTTGN